MAFEFNDLTSSEKVSAIYVAFYGRAADPAGRDFWRNQLEDAGGDLTQIIDAFGDSEETEQRFGAEGNTEAVQTLYRQIFNREPEEDGLNFFVNGLEDGTFTRESIAVDILTGAQNEDATTAQNKIDVAQTFTDALSQSNSTATVANTRFVVSSVDDTDASVQAAQSGASFLTSDQSGLTISGEVLEDGAQVQALDPSAGALQVGSEGSGFLGVTGGTSLTATSEGFDNVEVAAGAESNGFLAVKGSDSALSTQGADNTINIGRQGQGSLLVTDGADLETLELQLGREGRGEGIISGSDTRVLVNADNGRFSGELSNEAGLVGVGQTDGSYGRLALLDGALLEATANEQTQDGPGITIARNPGSRGEFVVDNSTARFTNSGEISNFAPFVSVADGGKGTLNVRNNGLVTVSGDQANFTVGNQGGSTGTVNLTSGGRLETLFVSLGFDAEASGILNIAGDGSELVAQGTAGPSSDFAGAGAFVTIGRSGNGTATIRDGGAITVTTEEGNFPGMQIARDPGSSGEMTVTGGSSEISFSNTSPEFANSTLTVGRNGDATLSVENAATIRDVLFVSVGSETQGDGRLIVDGNQSRLSITGTAGPETADAGDGAFLNIARSGKGIAEVRDGAEVRIQTQDGDFPGLQVGRNEDATGALEIKGPGSTVTVENMSDSSGFSAGFLVVGRNGEGTVTIGDASQTANDAGGPLLANDADGISGVGIGAGSSGSVTITGSGSAFEAGEKLLIGVSPNGFDDFDPDNLGFDAGGTGTVTIEEGGTLDAGAAANDGTDDIFIGTGGSLEVESGATLVGDVRVVGGTFDLAEGATHEGQLVM